MVWQRLAARNGHFDAGLDFCQQSLRACPTNQEVLCLHNLLLVLSGRQDNARLQREKLLRDYPLNATLWWLNWLDGRSESALAQWRGLCQGRDVNALMTAGQLINWGMPTLAARDAERTGLPAHAAALSAGEFIAESRTRRTGRKSH